MRWIPVCSKRYFCYLPYLLDRGQFNAVRYRAFLLCQKKHNAPLYDRNVISSVTPLDTLSKNKSINVSMYDIDAAQRRLLHHEIGSCLSGRYYCIYFFGGLD